MEGAEAMAYAPFFVAGAEVTAWSRVDPLFPLTAPVTGCAATGGL